MTTTYGSAHVVTTDESSHLFADAYFTANLTPEEVAAPVAVPRGVLTVVPDEEEVDVLRVHNFVNFSTSGMRQSNSSRAFEVDGNARWSVVLDTDVALVPCT